MIKVQLKLHKSLFSVLSFLKEIQGDQKVSVHLTITMQKVTSNVQSVPRQSPDIYWHAELRSRRPCSDSTIHIPNVFCDGHLQFINCVRIVLYSNRQVHTDFLITRYVSLWYYRVVNVHIGVSDIPNSEDDDRFSRTFILTLSGRDPMSIF
jgi:hypothetical protein